MIVTYDLVGGAPPNPQHIGQLKAVLVDVTLESETANDAGDFTVDPVKLGLSSVLAVVDAGVKAGGEAGDVARAFNYVPATGVLTFYATDHGALDLDDNDTSTARLLFLGY